MTLVFPPITTPSVIEGLDRPTGYISTVSSAVLSSVSGYGPRGREVEPPAMNVTTWLIGEPDITIEGLGDGPNYVQRIIIMFTESIGN